MANGNQDIEAYLQLYCDSRYPPHFAVLISGPWGSGKTHFVQKFLREHESDRSSKSRHIYVSLYGLQNFQQIEDAFFRQLHPLLATKGMKLAASVARGLLKTTLKIDLYGQSANVSSQIPEVDLPDYLVNTAGRILVFDDVERCHIPLNDLLGYINSFVEHDDCKVILIANERELPKADTQSDAPYGRIKEKLIGKTFEVKPEFESALKEFIDTIDTPDLSSFYKKNSQEVRLIFDQSESSNLRVLQQTMWDFERFFRVLSKRHRDNSKVLMSLFRLFFATSIEFRIGNLSEVDVLEILEPDWSRIIAEPEKRADFPYDKVRKRYPEVEFEPSLLTGVLLRDIIARSVIAASEITAQLDQSHIMLAPGTELPWRVLWYGRIREDTEIDPALVEFERQFAAREFLKPTLILHVMGVRIWLAQIGAIQQTTQSVVSEAKAYIDDLLSRGALVGREGEDRYESEGADGLGYMSIGTPEFKEIRTYLKTKEVVAIEQSYPKRAQILLRDMKEDVEKFLGQVCISGSAGNSYADVPILKFIDSSVFVNAVLSLPRERQRRAFFALQERYAHPFNFEKLKVEIPWLMAVKKEFEQAAASLKPIPQRALLDSVEYTFKPILDSQRGDD